MAEKKANVAAEAIVPATGKVAKVDKQGRPETHDNFGETHDDGGTNEPMQESPAEE
jgi:hypothetical protein